MKKELLEISRQITEIAERLNALAARLEQDGGEPELIQIEQPEPTAVAQNCEAAEFSTIPQPPRPIQFTLNDRYRFLREIFGNSTQGMTDAISEIERLGSAEDVTVYAVQTLNLDPQQQIVKDFLAAVNERFNERPTLLG